MNIQSMKYILEISKRKSINAASNDLFISQQALSKSIKSMESELNIKLFDRSYQGIQLTAEGQIVCQHLETILNEYQQMLDDLHHAQTNTQSQLTDKINIYINPLSQNSVIQLKLKKFLEKNNQVRFYTMRDDTWMILQYLQTLSPEERRNTIAVVNTICTDIDQPLPQFLPSDGYRYYNFSKGKYYACISKKSPLARCKRLSLKKLLKEPIAIVTRPDYVTYCPIYALLRQYGEPNITFASNSEEMWMDEIIKNRSIGFLADNALIQPQAVFKELLDEVALVEIKEQCYLNATCIIAEEPSEAVLALKEYLLEQ